MSTAYIRRNAPRHDPILFRRGDRVEVASNDDGYYGSYYEATVVSDLERKDYIVRYATLVKDDYSGPLIEVATGAEVRPKPPQIQAVEFRMNDVVDAFDNDGWWVGRITDLASGECRVFFDYTGDEIWYPNGRLRFHQDWIDGMWVCQVR